MDPELQKLPRAYFVKEAAGALRAVLDPARLYRLVRIEGYHKFRVAARRFFKSEADYRFTDQEIRWMYEYLDRYVTTMQTLYQREQP
jgi:hypothetical protein